VAIKQRMETVCIRILPAVYFARLTPAWPSI